MGKRSDFTRRKNDLYETFDPRAVAALLPYLSVESHFIEPCAGSGMLLRQLEAAGHRCVGAYDISPGHPRVLEKDALQVIEDGVDCFITNPPWTRKLLHPLIVHLSDQAPTWLLFDADWMHTKQARPYLSRLRRIVSVGRLKWMPGTKMDGKDNCCWYLFGPPVDGGATLFFGR